MSKLANIYRTYGNILNLVPLMQEVAIKQLDRDGVQGVKEFIVEVTMLSLADHPNLVKLFGFCAERDQKLLVYEYMPLGSLETHLHGIRYSWFFSILVCDCCYCC